MKLVTFKRDSRHQLGIKTEAGILDAAALAGIHNIQAVVTPQEFAQIGLNALDSVRLLLEKEAPPEYIYDEATLDFSPVILNPQKILCVGLNYSRHAAEAGHAEPPEPVLFSKFNNTLAGHRDNIPYYPEYTQVDYESELIVVIGREARYVSEADALDYVLGYCNGNDLSERKLQLNTPGGQWLLGKTPDKFLPIGPYLVTADEAGDPQQMTIQGWLNGEEKQASHTGDMIFSVAEIIAFASRYMTLYPGDLISTGTPEGVILGDENPVWMQPGDTYTVEIGNLGRLTNTLVEITP